MALGVPQHKESALLPEAGVALLGWKCNMLHNLREVLRKFIAVLADIIQDVLDNLLIDHAE